MRMFRALHAPALDSPVYCCQEDGMVGLGCGARSYTHALHYSSEYAVGARGVRAILNDYVKKDAAAFDHADYGFALEPDEQRRRYIIQSQLLPRPLRLRRAG
jgi:oxygen-independent coproporphyrinogen-3 oxidase